MTKFYVLVAALVYCLSGLLSNVAAEEERVLPFLIDFKLSQRILETTDESATTATDANVENIGKCTIPQRLEVGFKREGNAFRITATPTVAENCAFLCANVVKGCVAMNYDQTNKVCYFLGNPGAIYIAKDYTTALLNPSKDTICNSDNMILDYSRPGNDMTDNPYILSTATDCCNLCAATKDCIAYDFVYTVNHCWLKHAISPIRLHETVVTGLLCTEFSAQTVTT